MIERRVEMVYLMMDTNIYLDVFFDRNKSVSVENIRLFAELLNRGEIRLLVPGIVEHEVRKYIVMLIDDMEERLKELSKGRGIYSIYGLDGVLFDADEFSTKLHNNLRRELARFSESKEFLVQKLMDVINELFSHEFCIRVHDDKYINGCVRRYIYKIAPCHLKNKEELADALIVETFIHSNDYIDFEEGDRLVFATNNAEDFCENKNGESFHSDIVCDLESKGLYDRVEFVRRFEVLINKTLECEIKRSRLEERFRRMIEVVCDDYRRKLAKLEFDKEKLDRMFEQLKGRGFTSGVSLNEMCEKRG